MNDLVKRLSEGSHPVEVSLRPERTVKLFREMLDRGHVLVKFTQTKGGSEVGFPLDYAPVRVVADIELPSLEGQGHLEILAEERAA